MYFQPNRLLSSQPKSRALSTSRADSSILAYQRQRVQSRNRPIQRQQFQAKPYRIKASVLGEIFQANEALFRQSLAFHFPSELTPRPHRSYLNSLLRSQLKRQDYHNGKKDAIKRRRYVSSYNVPRKVQSCLLEL